MKDLPLILESIKKTERLEDVQEILLKGLSNFTVKKDLEVKKFRKLINGNIAQYKEELDFIIVNVGLSQKILFSSICLIFISSVIKEVTFLVAHKKLDLRQSVEFQYVQFIAEYESIFSLLVDILKNQQLFTLGLLPDVLLKSSFKIFKSFQDLLNTIVLNNQLNADSLDFISLASKQAAVILELMVFESQYKHLESKDILSEIGLS